VFASLGYKSGDFPVTERVASQGLSLPMNPYLKQKEVDEVCMTIGVV
jgi:UDP-2-acetamido-2-deoxy-ribo-hexuluronate aminotransferase